MAKAFDQYCLDIGYEKASPVIKDWLSDTNPNIRRTVTEGLRIWTGREYFKDHPDIAVKLLSQLRDDKSEYVRRSVGNALRDISKKHMDLINSELESWNISNKRIEQTYKLASKFIKPRIKKIIEGMMKNGSPAILSRGKKLLQHLN